MSRRSLGLLVLATAVAVLICAGSGGAVGLDDLHIDQPPDITVTADSLCNGTYCALVSYSLSASGGFPPYSFVCDGPGNHQFYLVGSHSVSCFAQDSEDDSTPEVSFTVTVNPPAQPDTSPPVFHNVPGTVRFNAYGPDGQLVWFNPPTATDDVDGAVPVTCDHASNTTFPVGTTTVTCRASDSHGNTASTSFDVVVTNVNAPSGGSTTTTTAPMTTQTTTTPPVTTTSAPPPTTTTHRSSATKAATAAAPAAPVVRDTTAPRLAAHRNLVVDATSPHGATIVYAVSATDRGNPSEHIAIDCSPPSGATLPLGRGAATRTATVTCSAHDAAGNVAPPLSFTVTVRGAADQLAALAGALRRERGLSVRRKAPLLAELAGAGRDVRSGRRAAAGAQLDRFSAGALRLPKAAGRRRAEWARSAGRIRRVLA